MFNVGDLAVYPAHGVGIIEKLKHRRSRVADRTFMSCEFLTMT